MPPGDVVGSANIKLRMDTQGVKSGTQVIRRDIQRIKKDILETQLLIRGRGGLMPAADLKANQKQLRALNLELATMEKTLRQVQGSGRKFQSGLRQIRSGMSQAAIIAFSTKSAFGQIAQGLFLLGPGEGAIIAVAAGLAIVGFTLKKLRDRSKKTAEKFKEMVDEIVKDAKRLARESQIRGLGGDLLAQQVELQEDLAFHETGRLGILQDIRDEWKASGSLIKIANADIASQNVLLKSGTKEQRERFKAFTDFVLITQIAIAENKAQIQETGKESSKAAKKEIDFLKKIRDRHHIANVAGRALLDTLRVQNIVLIQGATAAARYALDVKLLTLGFRGLDAELKDEIRFQFELNKILENQRAIREGIARFTEQSKETIKKIKNELASQAETEARRIHAIGERIGQQLIQGIVNAILEGSITIGQVLRRVLAAAATSIIGNLIPFGDILGGLFSRGGGGNSPGFAVGRLPSTANLALAGTGGTLVVPVSAIPPNVNPISAARDRQWLALFSETQKIAPSLGIRMVLR